ncbi:MAG: SAM-dependent methyltransferase [Proteobacteria bacterium]|nr:MAG: SAM-dependent methyltransferase [Pseudomonadota bacterium]
MELKTFEGMWGEKNAAGEEIWFSPLNKKLLAGNASARRKYSLSPLHYWAIRDMGAFLEKHKSQPSPRIIDFGCGTGSETIHLASCIGHPIKGYDIFPTQLAIADAFEKDAKTGCSFGMLNDGKIPEADASIDVIYSSHVLGHVPDVKVMLKDWARVLKPGGQVALYTESNFSPVDTSMAADIYRKFNVSQLRDLEHHISLYPREELEPMFAEAGFTFHRRVAYNAWKPVFDPSALKLLLSKSPASYRPVARFFLNLWSRVRKVVPFYPLSVDYAYMLMGKSRGTDAYSDCYYYLLEKKPS